MRLMLRGAPGLCGWMCCWMCALALATTAAVPAMALDVQAVAGLMSEEAADKAAAVEVAVMLRSPYAVIGEVDR
jgi:hypothetical protein